ncbi:MAG: energy transducer TonB, partial [Bacteroidota bacterium]
AAVENSQMSGTVVIGMCVNESGSVTEAEFKQGGSSTRNIQLVEAALHSARSYKFNSGTVDKQCGEITYRFRVQ